MRTKHALWPLVNAVAALAVPTRFTGEHPCPRQYYRRSQPHHPAGCHPSRWGCPRDKKEGRLKPIGLVVLRILKGSAL